MKKHLLLLATLAMMGCHHFPVHAQVGVVPFRSSRATFTDTNGVPLAGGCIYTYLGGTSTPQATYTDYTGGTSNPDPVILDSSGSAVMWLGPNNYKFIAWSYGGTNCATGALQWTVDQIPGDAFLNGTISGATITNPTINGGSENATTINGDFIDTSFIDSTSIGATSPSYGNFTRLSSAVDNLTFSGTPTFNASNYGYFAMTLSANVTSSTLTGGVAGELVTFNICQNSTGGYTFAWPGNLATPLNTQLPGVNQAPLGCTVLTAYFTGSDWEVIYSNAFPILAAVDNLTFSPTPVFNAQNYSSFNMTLTGNVTSSTAINIDDGQVLTITLCQNGAGGYTFAWPSIVVNPPIVNPTASACTSVLLVFSAVADQLQVVSSYGAAASPIGGETTTLGSNFTTTSTTLAATALVLPSIPASVTARGSCNLVWQQNTAAATVSFGVGLTSAPTWAYVFAQNQIAVPAVVTSVTSGSPVSVDTVTPGAATTTYTETLNFTAHNGASGAEVITIYGLTSNAADALQILQGSSCGWLP